MRIIIISIVFFLSVFQTLYSSGLEITYGSSGHKDYGYVDDSQTAVWDDYPTFSVDKKFFGVVYGYGGSSTASNVASFCQSQNAIALESMTYLLHTIDTHLSESSDVPVTAGAGALVCCVNSVQETLSLASIGESRAVLFYQDGSRQTLVHKRKYGVVEQSNLNKHVVLPNGIQVKSALGDFASRNKKITRGLPKVILHEMNGKERFLIMATPQFWHHVSRATLGAFMSGYYGTCPHELAKDLMVFAQNKACLKGRDLGNAHVGVVAFMKDRQKESHCFKIFSCFS